jgi:hypothetical protein
MKYFLVILLTMSILSAQKAQFIAVVLKAKGEVELNSNGKTINVKRGTKIYNNDIVKTKDKGYLTLRFMDDKSTLRVRKNSIVKINVSKEKSSVSKNIALEVGDIFLSVVKKRGRTRVSTPTSVASVKGTKFQSVFDPNTGDHITYTTEGTVEVDVDGKKVDVEKGTIILAKKDGTFEMFEGSDIGKLGLTPFDEEEDGESDMLEFEYEDENGNKKAVKIKLKDNE